MGRRTWSRTDLDRLFDLRDVQKLKWREIGERLGISAALCCTRYQYYKSGGTARPAEVSAPATAKSDGPIKPVRVADIIQRPRYFHEADADIAARIERQGLTAGFLGDPPPGRSALDQRRGEIQNAP